MSCRRAYDLDVAAFLGSAAASEWTDFREHYPRCADCAAEVRAWTEIQVMLEEGAHPAEELLVRFEAQPEALAPAERMALERHVTACRSCRDELRTLRRFDFRQIGQTAAAPRRRRRIPAFDVVARIVWHPAFAYALVLILAYPALVGRFGAPPAPPAVGTGAEEPATLVDRAERSRDDSARFKRETRQEAPRNVAPPAAPAARSEVAERRAAKMALEAEAPAVGAISLRAGERMEVAAERLGPTLTLRVPVPAGPPGMVEVRVLDAAGGRELRGRFPSPASDSIEMPIPSAWLSAGAYHIELYRLDGSAVPTGVFDLDVRG